MLSKYLPFIITIWSLRGDRAGPGACAGTGPGPGSGAGAGAGAGVTTGG